MMKPLDPNKCARWIALIILALLAVGSNYRFEIGRSGLKFESNASPMREGPEGSIK